MKKNRILKEMRFFFCIRFSTTVVPVLFVVPLLQAA